MGQRVIVREMASCARFGHLWRHLRDVPRVSHRSARKVLGIYVPAGRVISTRCVPPTWRRRNTFEAISLGAPVAHPQRSVGASLGARRKSATGAQQGRRGGVSERHVSRGHGLSVRFPRPKRCANAIAHEQRSVATVPQTHESCHSTEHSLGHGTALASWIGQAGQGRARERDGGRRVSPIP